VDRDRAECDQGLKQIVACAVLRHEDEVMCLRRSRHSNRANLRMKYTLMVGGHVDRADEVDRFPPRHCVRREIREELGIDVGSTIKLLGVVSDPLSYSGWLHLGLVFEAFLPSDTIELSKQLDSTEFVNSGRRHAVRTTVITRLTDIHDRLDPWSRLFCESRTFCNRYRRVGQFRSSSQLLLDFRSTEQNGPSVKPT